MSQAVLDVNDSFYRAIRNGDYAGMEALWAARRRVSCTHPGWTELHGREDVMESWRMILLEQDPPELWPVEARAVVTGGTAIVVCVERMGVIELMACNSFVHEDGAWRLLNHQAARIPAEQAQ